MTSALLVAGGTGILFSIARVCGGIVIFMWKSSGKTISSGKSLPHTWPEINCFSIVPKLLKIKGPPP